MSAARSRLLRVALRVVLVAVAALSGVVAIVVLVNFSDEALDARAATLLKEPEPPAAAAYALWAFDAPEGVDAAVVGRTVVDAWRRLAAESPYREDWHLASPYLGDRASFPLEVLCMERDSACMASYPSHAANVRAMGKARGYLLDRLMAITHQDNWQEVEPPASPQAPRAPLAVVAAAHQLMLALAAVDASEGHGAAAVAHLEDAAAAARRLMAGATTLQTKMLGVSLYRRTLLAYSELLDTAQDRKLLAASLAKLAEPSANEQSLAAPASYEARVARVQVLQLTHPAPVAGTPWSERVLLYATPLLLKPDATTNLEAQLIEIELPILSVDAREFGQAFAATRTRAAQRRDALSTLDVRSIYNPLGKILAAGLPALMEYAARLHDIDALAHAVRAKGAVLALGVRANAVEGFLSAAGPELRDVYSQAPFHWQADPSVLDVPVRGSGSIARLSMRVASP